MNKKSLLLNSLLLLFSTAISLLIVEQTYRFYLFGSASFSIEKMNSVHDIGISGLIKPSDYNEIIYELKPELDTYFKLAKFKTNSAGLRDKEYKFTKPNDFFRVAVIGDSFVMPAGVEIDKSFYSLLEKKLNAEQADVVYEFMNFGVGGYNLRQYLGVIKYKASRYDPDLIMVSFCPHNDHLVPSDDIFTKRYDVKPETYPFYQSFIAKSLLRLGRQLTSKNNNESATSFSIEQREYMSNIFSKMNSISKINQTPIIIIYLTNSYNKRYADQLKDLVESSGLSFADASLPFKGLDINEYIIYPIDAHPNEKAHIIFAEELHAYLSSG